MDNFSSFIDSVDGIKLAQTVVVLLIIWALVRLAQKGLNNYVGNSTSRYHARKILRIGGVVLALMAVMLMYNYKFSNLTLALGVAGAGIAFALQEVIISIVGFLAILFGNFYKVGDRVQLGGIKGDVVDIGVLRTTLMELGDWVNGDLYNGKMVRVANSFIFKDPVYNYSGDFPFLWDELSIPIRHSSDYTFAKSEILKIATDYTKDFTIQSEKHWNKLTQELYVEDAQITPMITLSFDENWITLTLRYVVDFKARRRTKDHLYSEILKLIKANENKVAIAASSLEISRI